MVQRTVLKVDISCSKCKKKLLKAISALEGVDKVEADVAKGTLSVTGNADPYKIIVSARKAAGKHADVVSVGPPPAPPKPQGEGQKKPEEKKGGGGGEANKKVEDNKKNKENQVGVVSHNYFHDPRTCPECQRVVFVPMDGRAWNSEPSPSSCSIM